MTFGLDTLEQYASHLLPEGCTHLAGRVCGMAAARIGHLAGGRTLKESAQLLRDDEATAKTLIADVIASKIYTNATSIRS